MMPTDSLSHLSTQGYIIEAIIVLFIIGRQLVTRAVNPWSLCLLPAVIVGALVVSLPGVIGNAGAAGYAALVVGLALGASLGIARAAVSRMRIEPATGRVILQGSIWSPLLYIAVLGARIAVTYFTAGAPAPILTAVTIGLLALTVSTIAARRAALLVKYLQASKSFAR